LLEQDFLQAARSSCHSTNNIKASKRL